MKGLKMRRAAWLLTLVAVVALTLALSVLAVGAENACEHAEGFENGFCIGCDAAQEAPFNEGYYEISNAGQLYYVAQQIRGKQANETIKIKLMCNITVNADLLDAQGKPSAGTKRVWEPLGIEGAVVQNVDLHGQGYYISGLYADYNDGRDVGLFGKVKGVVVENLGIVDSYFATDTGIAGGVIAYALDECYLSYCYTDVALKSVSSGVGGIAGTLEKDTVGCTAEYCYTTSSAAFYWVDSTNLLDNCYYRADSETDSLSGTHYFDADMLLEDEETTLLAALSTGTSTWVSSCRTGMPALRIEHSYEYPCTIECLTCHDTGRTDRAPHAYEHDCDRYCEVCNSLNPTPVDHVGFTTCGTVCRKCGTTITAKTEHQYDFECDTTCDCGYVRADAKPHEFAYECETRCKYCNEIMNPTAAHQYDNDCDIQCNYNCGTTRAPAHVYDSVCDAECNVCKKTRVATHQYGDYTVTKEPTALKNGEKTRTCALCGNEEHEVIARTGVATWVIVLLGIGTGSVLFGAGFCVYWFLIRKRKNKKDATKQKNKKAKNKKS